MLRRTIALLGIVALTLAISACTPVETTTTVKASAATVTKGKPVTLTATISPATASLGGTVTFTDGSTTLGVKSVSNGKATLTTSALKVGTRTIGARFAPSTTAANKSAGSTTVKVQQFHLALGDSLAAGVGAASGHGYVPDITAGEVSRHPGLVLKNISCSGATTTSMLAGGGCSYVNGTQVAAAVSFLLSNPGAVSFITIDIGANDITPCVTSSGTDPVCSGARLPTVEANLALILQRLHAAAPGVPIVGMTYYNPFLAFWVAGNQAGATGSNAGAVTFNDALTTTYGDNTAGVAPVAEAFDTSNFALTGTWNGTTVPQNVANICAWTRMCTNGDIHANDTGHAKIAGAFLPVLDALVPTG